MYWVKLDEIEFTLHFFALCFSLSLFVVYSSAIVNHLSSFKFFRGIRALIMASTPQTDTA